MPGIDECLLNYVDTVVLAYRVCTVMQPYAVALARRLIQVVHVLC